MRGVVHCATMFRHEDCYRWASNSESCCTVLLFLCVSISSLRSSSRLFCCPSSLSSLLCVFFFFSLSHPLLHVSFFLFFCSSFPFVVPLPSSLHLFTSSPPSSTLHLFSIVLSRCVSLLHIFSSLYVVSSRPSLVVCSFLLLCSSLNPRGSCSVPHSCRQLSFLIAVFSFIPLALFLLLLPGDAPALVLAFRTSRTSLVFVAVSARQVAQQSKDLASCRATAGATSCWAPLRLWRHVRW